MCREFKEDKKSYERQDLPMPQCKETKRVERICEPSLSKAEMKHHSRQMQSRATLGKTSSSVQRRESKQNLLHTAGWQLDQVRLGDYGVVNPMDFPACELRHS
jgi:hypothetical protein